MRRPRSSAGQGTWEPGSHTAGGSATYRDRVPLAAFVSAPLQTVNALLEQRLQDPTENQIIAEDVRFRQGGYLPRSHSRRLANSMKSCRHRDNDAPRAVSSASAEWPILRILRIRKRPGSSGLRKIERRQVPLPLAKATIISPRLRCQTGRGLQEVLDDGLHTNVILTHRIADSGNVAGSQSALLLRSLRPVEHRLLPEVMDHGSSQTA